MKGSLFGTATSTWILIFVLLSLVDRALQWKLCPSENQWYDADTGKCNACSSCGTKSLELEPCSEFRNTLCVDLNSIKFDFKDSVKKVPQPQPHRWHEMETEDEPPPQVLTASMAKLAAESSVGDKAMWDAVVVSLGIVLVATFCAVAVLLGKHMCRVYYFRKDDRRVASRARLFSRDRLNTTEYMHNLATLDRRLAMDEILEKRKKAILEPQLLCENIYTDDVFIDISGFPLERSSSRMNEHDQEHRQSLLRTEERQ